MGGGFVVLITYLVSFCIKLAIDKSVTGGNLLRMKFDFIFVIKVSLKSHISLKPNRRLDSFMKGTN